MRPARGCNCDGSGREGPVRKEETSCAVDGSKGVGRKVSAGSWRRVEDDEEEDEGEDEDEDLRPVRESQIDILKVDAAVLIHLFVPQLGQIISR